MCVEWIAVRYKCKVFETTLPICGELLPYVLYATHFMKLDNWAGYGATVFMVQKSSHDLVLKAYILQVLGSMLCHKRLKTK